APDGADVPRPVSSRNSRPDADAGDCRPGDCPGPGPGHLPDRYRGRARVRQGIRDDVDFRRTTTRLLEGALQLHARPGLARQRAPRVGATAHLLLVVRVVRGS